MKEKIVCILSIILMLFTLCYSQEQKAITISADGFEFPNISNDSCFGIVYIGDIPIYKLESDSVEYYAQEGDTVNVFGVTEDRTRYLLKKDGKYLVVKAFYIDKNEDLENFIFDKVSLRRMFIKDTALLAYSLPDSIQTVIGIGEEFLVPKTKTGKIVIAERAKNGQKYIIPINGLTINKVEELDGETVEKYYKCIENNIKGKFRSDVIKGLVTIGMSDKMVLISWGQPRNINRTVTSWGVNEQWVYTNKNLYFENGVLSAFQDFIENKE